MTCECKEVTAYKDSKGSLHTTKEACQRANESYEAERKRRELASRLDQICKAVFPPRFRVYGHQDQYEVYAEQAFLRVLELNWRSIRDQLNAIPE